MELISNFIFNLVLTFKYYFQLTDHKIIFDFYLTLGHKCSIFASLVRS